MDQFIGGAVAAVGDVCPDRVVGQPGILHTNHTYGNAIGVAPDGSVYVGAYSTGLGGAGYDWWLKKYNSSGTEDTTNWDLIIDGTVGNDYVYAIEVASDGSVYAAGEGFGISSSSDDDWWIKKFDAAGTEDTVNWNKSVDSNGDAYAYRMAIATDGSVYVVGNGSNEFPTSDRDWMIRKYAPDGTEP